MRRLFVTFILIVVLAILSAAPVAAGRRWCARDPLVGLNGAPVQILIAVPEEYLPAINGPVVVKIQSPAATSRAVLFTDEGFNGYGEIVKFSDLTDATVAADGSFDVTVSARVPVDLNVLQALGRRNKRIPFQIQVTANGELQTTESGTPTMLSGDTWVAEGTNAGTKVTFSLQPVPVEPAS